MSARRARRLLAILACASPLLQPAPLCARSVADRIEFAADGNFSETAVRRGVRATREQCDVLPDAVWVGSGGPAGDAGGSGDDAGGECLRYWTAGIPNGVAKRVIVFFAGDIWGGGQVEAGYPALSLERMRDSAEVWAKRLDAPYIFFARPGTYGSSGDHMQRRRIAESTLVSAALDRIKGRLKVEEFVLVGQSGGGHVVSSLLTFRQDVVCAVPTSAPSSPRIRWQIRGARRDMTGYTDSYEPSEHLDRSRMNPALRVFVLGDPKDLNVVWPSQQVLADKLREAGVAVQVLHGEGRGPVRHSLADSGRIVASWCYHDVPTDEIVRRAARGLRG